MQNEMLSRVLDTVAANKPLDVYLVACGGSLSIMHAGRHLVAQKSRKVTAHLYNADEFFTCSPIRNGRDAVVITCSQTGTTKETARAAEHAVASGITTVAMTMDPDSPLGKATGLVFAYESGYSSGSDINSANSNYAVLFRILAGIVDKVDGGNILSNLESSLANFQPAIERAHDIYAERLKNYVSVAADSNVVYTLGSGPNFGAAYSFAICVLMEMQWINSQAIHANEFFHGPFEIVDKDSAFIVMIGLDETRPLAERARDFLLRFGDQKKILVLDSNELDLKGIDPEWAPYMVPLVMFDALWIFIQDVAAKRKHPMFSGRRYMKKITNY